jgi:pimeloyl-ACP methyl ester carboxylesterase
MRHSWRSVAVSGSVAVLLAVVPHLREAAAGEMTLKDGLVVSGKLKRLQALAVDAARPVRQRETETLSLPFVMVENGYERIFVGRQQIAKLDERDDLGRFETFTLRQHRTGFHAATGTVVETSPFNEFGQRSHKLRTSRGIEEIVVGATKLNPLFIACTGLNVVWDYGVATNSLPVSQLDVMIRKATDRKNPDHRFAIARFYLQAGFYDESGKELESIAKDFPELAPRVADARKELQNYEHRLILQELGRRKTAGQYELAHAAASAVPQNEASATVLHDVQELLRDYDTAHERMAKVRLLLAELQAKLDQPDQVTAVMSMRSVVEEQLSMEALDRLQAFFNLMDDTTLKPSEKLALAYSGWVVGSASAVTDLGLAIRMWHAQHAILEYLRSENPHDRKDRLAELTALDGITPEVVLKLIRCLPPTIEPVEMRPAVAASLKVAGHESEERPTYDAIVPPEYDWRHSYPMIVALHPLDRSVRAELEWWAGTTEKPGLAQKRGYIVIAPEYSDAGQHSYNYSVTAHDAVLRAIVDARKRFNVDSDRVFLTGHGMGGDAAFDIGMSHPDQFAGVIPINGLCDGVCKWYTRNAAHTQWFVVCGEFDGRSTFTANASTLGRMMRDKTDVVLVEYIQRGYESYHEEGPRIFDWMEPLRRQKPPREFRMSVLRPSESRFYWLQAESLPQSVMEPTFLAGPAKGVVKPMVLSAKITPGNTIYLMSGGKSNSVWLSPDFVNFSQRVQITLRGTQKFHGIVRQSVEAILDDFRLRADRQTLYTARIDLN